MAARRTHVPKFGNWDANDHMPYTVVFDNARQASGRGKPMNPNDPSDNPLMFGGGGKGGLGGGGGGGAPGVPKRHFNPNDPEDSPEGSDHHPQQERERAPAQERAQEKPQERPQERQPERPIVQQAGGSTREGSGSGSGAVRVGAQPQQQPHQVAAGAERRRGPSGHANVPSRGPSADLTKRTSRDNILDRNIDSPSTSFSDQSPSHPAGARYEGSQTARGATRLGGNSPAWDPTRRKSVGEDGQMFAPATPNRSRLGNGKNARDESSGKGTSAALPKFGAWDAQDPGSGDGFTVIFNNARNEKKTGGPVNIVRTPDKDNSDLYGSPEPGNYNKGHSRGSSWWCCFAPDVKS